MTLMQVTLDDKYGLEARRIYLSGIQALVRLPMLQRQRDRAAGLNTGGFISGYRGSPLGGYDNALWRAKRFLQRTTSHFQPGLNEDLAATAVWGSQQVNLFPAPRSMACSASGTARAPASTARATRFKHGNAAGTSRAWRRAGAGRRRPWLPVLDAAASERAGLHRGDDADAEPGEVQEYLDFGLLGFALSRYSGCWVGFKAIAETVESAASVDVDPSRVRSCCRPISRCRPAGSASAGPTRRSSRNGGCTVRRWQAVAAFARANRSTASCSTAAGAARHRHHRQGLSRPAPGARRLGIDERAARDARHAHLQGRLTWPLEAERRAAFRRRLQR